MKAQTRISRIYNTYKEAKRAKRWDADRECYLDPQGNIAVNPDSISVDALIQQFAEEEEEEARQKEWWGGGEEKVEEKEEKVKMAEKMQQTKKIDDGTITYLNNKKVEDLTKRVREVENQILNRDKMLKASNDRAKALTEKIGKIDLSEVKSLKQTKRKMNFEKDKPYYTKPVVPSHAHNKNQNRWPNGYQGGKNYPRKNGQNKRSVEKKVFVKGSSSSSLSEEEPKIFSKSNKEFFEEKKPKTEVVESLKKKDDVKGKTPMFVEKNVLKNENAKFKTEPTKNDRFYKRVASSQQIWKPKGDEPKARSSKPKVSETEKSSSSTKKMYVPLDLFEKLQKQKSTSEKKYVVKKDQ
ncbi:golgin subfamily A member 6-like protein 22 [Helianthus annuus]|uniref:golgin subfamily A member 6-like protein 22 n=1 Tax=Helianthus annuus TaxID=4232 RepID=UPI000B906729|nr:golgin subfamily A member 6-like protein 22 [Helianthus annuus]